MTQTLLVLALASSPALAGSSAPSSPEERFRQGGELARSADTLGAIGVYRELAAQGKESASLYWNWAQAAASVGASGEAMWALLRARELSPGEGAIKREIEEQRAVANLDPAEIAPETLGTLARTGRRYRLDLLGLVLLALSVLAHGASRFLLRSRSATLLAQAAVALGVSLCAVPLLGSLARPTGVVVQRGASLFDAASETAQVMGSLREGEVVPLLGRSGQYVRVEDSSGARGWARIEDVWRLDGAPPPP